MNALPPNYIRHPHHQIKRKRRMKLYFCKNKRLSVPNLFFVVKIIFILYDQRPFLSKVSRRYVHITGMHRLFSLTDRKYLKLVVLNVKSYRLADVLFFNIFGIWGVTDEYCVRNTIPEPKSARNNYYHLGYLRG